MSQWILCKSWWPPKKGQRGKFSKLWLLGILGSSDHLGPAAPRLMALTTLMSGMFWGMTRAVVQTTMHFQSLDLRMWHGAPAVWEVWEVWYLKVTYGHLGRARGAWWIHFFFCFEGLMIDFSSHGEDTNFYIETDVFF